MAVKTVEDLPDALEHIARYSSRHSEAILSNDADHIEHFLRSVDAAAVYANTSTAFTAGAPFGLGAEIGISTQKIHRSEESRVGKESVSTGRARWSRNN